jgi:uncharacterized protein YkwD
MRRIAILFGFCCLAMLVLAGNAPALGSKGGPQLGVPSSPVYKNNGSVVRTMALAGNGPALKLLSAPVDTCTGADDPNAGVAAQEQAMECMINFARQQAGMPKLVDSGRLGGSAASKAGDILRCNQFSHEACGRDFLFWFRRAGYLSGGCWWAGENLAWGTGNLGSVRSIARAWLHSPAHRANILGGEYREFGISLRIGPLSGAPGAHVWVNHFGNHC